MSLEQVKHAKAIFGNYIFHDETAAREWLEARLWPDGPVCPHCGVVDEATLMKGKSHRPGLYQCKACRKPFTVTVGTLYERSKVPLHKWLAATHFMMASKKGVSALQVGRMLGLSKKTAWFVCHRIRESLRETKPGPLGGQNKVVEADESFVGGKAPETARTTSRPKRRYSRWSSVTAACARIMCRTSTPGRSAKSWSRKSTASRIS